MRVNRRPPVTRAPVSLPPCRVCGSAITADTTRWDAERRSFGHACGALDPANQTGSRQQPSEETRDDDAVSADE